MLMSVNEFCSNIDQDINGFIDILTKETTRNNPREIESWRNSLPKISEILTIVRNYSNNFGETHIYVGQMIIEYKLPMASAWCDVVLLGDGKDSKPNVIIIENKDWDTKGDAVSNYESFIVHNGSVVGHPSDQVKGYAEYCKNFHSAVLDSNASVSGCVYFSKYSPIDVYRQIPNENLTTEYPVFSMEEDNFEINFSEYVTSKLYKSNEKFAKEFEKGIYKQDRNMILQVSKALKNKREISKPFVLIDNQRTAYNYISNILTEIKDKENDKHVFIVKGPYGSGKSALAANLWIDSAEKYSDKGNIVFVTTSSSQRSNWEKIFKEYSGILSGKFVVKTSNSFNPGLTPFKVKELREKGYTMDTTDYMKNLKNYEEEGNNIKVPDNNQYISIVDEAHALINPVDHTIGFSAGWCLQAGPQAYHIIRASQISVFLIHEGQSFRDIETTNILNIYSYAKNLDATVHEVIDLSGVQFRCGGSIQYEKWIENLFKSNDNIQVADTSKEIINFPKNEFDFEFVNDPDELDDLLIKKHELGNTVRLASSYSVKWKSKKNSNPHKLKEDEQDFFIKYKKNNVIYKWTRPWNYVNREDYSDFIQANPGTAMAENPLAEVGCPYVIRGFDYDYIGLLWLNDLVWRNYSWTVNLDNVHESAFPSTMKLAKLGNTENLLESVKKAYKILLTRAQKGIYLYVSDAETKEYLISQINDQ